MIINIDDVTNQILHGDCVEIMKTFPDESIDMILSDPPYGNKNNDGDFNASLNKHQDKGLDIKNDGEEDMKRVIDGMLVEAARVLKKTGVICCCCGGGGPTPHFAWLANRINEKGLEFFHSVIWDKKLPGLGWRYRRQYEMVMIGFRRGGKLLWRNPKMASRNIISICPPPIKLRRHPNEKPVEVMTYFINVHASPGHIILDPFSGSGSTAVAAKQTGRRFIGIELEDKYCQIARQRLDSVAEQRELFSMDELAGVDVLPAEQGEFNLEEE